MLDEGHRIKNMQGKLHEALSGVRTRRRLILTGTPMQNNLMEYHAMVGFVRPAHLGTVGEFKNRFVNPIVNGNTLDASAADVRLSRQRMAVLHDLVQPFLHRRSAEILRQAPPATHERSNDNPNPNLLTPTLTLSLTLSLTLTLTRRCRRSTRLRSRAASRQCSGSSTPPSSPT